VSNDRDLCPRCGNTFHCGAADAEPCACTTVRLVETTLSALRGQYERCLCLRCLIELQARCLIELQAEPQAETPTATQ
jgi:hypothetical protein